MFSCHLEPVLSDDLSPPSSESALLPHVSHDPPLASHDHRREDEEAGGGVSAPVTTMKQLAETHGLVLTDLSSVPRHRRIPNQQISYQLDQVPMAAFTQVSPRQSLGQGCLLDAVWPSTCSHN